MVFMMPSTAENKRIFISVFLQMFFFAAIVLIFLLQYFETIMNNPYFQPYNHNHPPNILQSFCRSHSCYILQEVSTRYPYDIENELYELYFPYKRLNYLIGSTCILEYSLVFFWPSFILRWLKKPKKSLIVQEVVSKTSINVTFFISKNKHVNVCSTISTIYTNTKVVILYLCKEVVRFKPGTLGLNCQTYAILVKFGRHI